MPDVRWNLVLGWGLGLGLLSGIGMIWMGNIFGYISTTIALVLTGVYGVAGTILVGYALK